MKKWQKAQQQTVASDVETPTTTEAPAEVPPVVEAPVVNPAAAGLLKIRQAINLLQTHSAARIGGSMMSDAIITLEEAYSIIAKG